jgi:RNA recognition motif-containing protein
MDILNPPALALAPLLSLSQQQQQQPYQHYQAFTNNNGFPSFPYQQQPSQQSFSRPPSSSPSSCDDSAASGSSGSYGSYPPHPPPGSSCCLFVGNLSYFCTDTHLHDLFDQYGHVQQVKIVMNDLNTRSLMFGFVTMASMIEATEMERLMNGMVFMGRKLRYG